MKNYRTCISELSKACSTVFLFFFSFASTNTQVGSFDIHEEIFRDFEVSLLKDAPFLIVIFVDKKNPF